LVVSGKIKQGTKWKQIYPLFAQDERYINILGNPGSNPLELFWDVVDSLDQKLETKIEIVEGAIRRHNDQIKAQDGNADSKPDGLVFKISPETNEDAFLDIMRADDDAGVKQLRLDEMKEIFRTVSSGSHLFFI
jgi:pre-mRNA-processing factor 40